MTGLLFIIGLVLVSGVVAYTGDNLGRRIGKARMMIFGLRPKYTSIVMAIITGMVITTITITALLLSSSNVRDMLLRMEKIRADLATAQTDLEKAAGFLADAQQALDSAKNELAKQRDELESKDLDVRLKQELIDEKEAELVVLGEKITGLAEQTEQLNEELTVYEAQLNSLQVQYDAISLQVRNKEGEIHQLTSEIHRKELERDRLSGEVEKLSSKVTKLEKEVDVTEAKLEDAIAREASMREHGVYVQKGQILSEFVIDTDLSYEQIVDRIRKAKYDWIRNSQDNIHGNPIAELTIDQYTDVIEDIRRYRDRFDDKRAVIRLVSLMHVFADEEIIVDLKAERYLLVYEEGKVVARKFFPGDEDWVDIYLGISEMFEDLKGEAQRKGMIFEGITTPVYCQSSVMLQTARKASYYAHDIYVKLVATKDIYNIEYLAVSPVLPEYDNMKLEIEEIKDDEEWYIDEEY